MTRSPKGALVALGLAVALGLNALILATLSTQVSFRPAGFTKAPGVRDAEAQTNSNTLVAENNGVIRLQFRKHRANVSDYSGIDGIGTFYDSLTATAAAAGSGVAGQCTTTAIPLAKYLSSFTKSAQAVDLDSLAVRLVIEDAGSSGSLDSLYFYPQFSATGQRNWVDGTVTTAPTYALTSLTRDGNPALGVAAVAAKVYTATLPLVRTITGSTTIARGSWQRWPYVRFIIVHDVSAAPVTNLQGFLIVPTAQGR